MSSWTSNFSRKVQKVQLSKAKFRGSFSEKKYLILPYLITSFDCIYHFSIFAPFSKYLCPLFQIPLFAVISIASNFSVKFLCSGTQIICDKIVSKARKHRARRNILEDENILKIICRFGPGVYG